MKDKKINDNEITADVRQLVRSLNNTLRGLEIANSDQALRLAYQQLLNFLANNDTQQLESIFGKCSANKRENSSNRGIAADEDIARLNIEDIEKILLTEDVSKANLAQIAAIRFSVTRGSLSKLSREALRIKLRNLIENEKTHQTISRVARSVD